MQVTQVYPEWLNKFGVELLENKFVHECLQVTEDGGVKRILPYLNLSEKLYSPKERA